eukprot:9814795-Alexandrium_andersonii.AAC.1
MSASLVGSEMCIRDSGSGAARARVRRAGKGRSQSRRLLRRPGLPCAVSYTHLTLPTICSV